MSSGSSELVCLEKAFSGGFQEAVEREGEEMGVSGEEEEGEERRREG